MGGIQFEERRRIRKGISHRTGTATVGGEETGGEEDLRRGALGGKGGLRL